VSAPIPLLSRPYEQRQYLAIAADIASLGKSVKADINSHPRGSALVSAAVAVGAVAAGTFAAPFVGLLGAGAVSVGLKAANAWVSTRAQLAADSGLAVEVARADDYGSLAFPPGHPRSKVLYVGHPFTAQRYIPLALFHRTLFEQKVIEAIELLAALGATSVEVQQIAGTESSASIGVSLGLPVSGIATDIGAKVGATTRARDDTLISATFKPNKPARVPSGLVWYPHEEYWKSMARLRLTGGLESYNLRVDYSDDFGVNARISAQAQGLGFNIGGTFSNLQSTTWVMKGSFAPLNAV
jgi:hypothetical protein